VATTADIRNGLVIQLEGALQRIIEFQHIKTARGGAKVWTKLKNVRTGQVTENTFRSGEKIDPVRLESIEMQYLYFDGQHYIFMNTGTYEQMAIDEELFKQASRYVKENEIVKIMLHMDTALDIEIPTSVVLEVTETEPGFKGDTVTGGTKPAVVETGTTVQVPIFIEIGDKIRVDTRSGEYLERIK